MSKKVNKYDEIISLGYNCKVASFKVRHNIKKETYPFDWLVSSIDFIIEVFETDNIIFNDISKLKTKTKNNYKYYRKYQVLAESIHDKEDNIKEINDKYNRRFIRLYKLLNSNLKILLVRVVTPKSVVSLGKDTIDNSNKILKLYNILKNKFKANIDLCIIDREQIINKNELCSNIIYLGNHDMEMSLKKFLF